MILSRIGKRYSIVPARHGSPGNRTMPQPHRAHVLTKRPRSHRLRAGSAT